MPQLDFQLLLHGQFYDWLLSGFLFSLQLTGLTLVLALPLATGVALLRLAPSRIAQALGFAYVEGIRSVPLLVHMLFWYFAAPEALPDGIKQWLYRGNVEATAAVIALTLYTAAYMGEDIRSGLRAVPRTQFEAARALGFSYLASMRLVVLPQALRITVPPLISQTLNLWKNTSIATVIGVAELMYQAQRVETASFRGFETFALVTAAYLSVSLLITALAWAFQQRYPVRAA
ncbi:amino acid ABC transporter permease [Paucibacter sp. B2R-40]|uniref:amino acid ABC transporter permease n=1 Tax=Paucibacter sp. B2R-40 TaxID=2893554 RepID=UPI0021E46C4C|nr:amino acid ABC transporter permease [Paucibacter sp. B2R-40]MCV2355691.1 amino acid ABC transporter permease [Paucibacter sp. B2R-40]